MDEMFWDLEGDCNKYLEHTTERIKFPGYMPVKASILFKKMIKLN